METNKPIVIKIGGSTLGSTDTTYEDLALLQKRGVNSVVVHGGGKVITDWLSRQKVPTKFVRGQRVTDKPTLDVVVAVLAGLVNKEIVADINARGGRAAGFCGVDGAIFQCDVKDPELGLVGNVRSVNPGLLNAVIGAGFMPVLASIGFKSGDPHGALNINADTVAGEVAAALGAEKLVFLTDVAGVCDSSGKLLKHLTVSEIGGLMSSGVISGGMIPKVEACLRALEAVREARIIDGRVAHALLSELEGKGEGTTIG